MTVDGENRLLKAIDNLADACPNYSNEVVRFLISDESASGREHRLLSALAMMVDQLLQRRDDQVDTLAMSDRADAVAALVEFELMEFVHPPRFARWTDAGRAFLADTLRQYPIRRVHAAQWSRRDTIRWAKRAAIGASIAGGGVLIGWLIIMSTKLH